MAKLDAARERLGGNAVAVRANAVSLSDSARSRTSSAWWTPTSMRPAKRRCARWPAPSPASCFRGESGSESSRSKGDGVHGQRARLRVAGGMRLLDVRPMELIKDEDALKFAAARDMATAGGTRWSRAGAHGGRNADGRHAGRRTNRPVPSARAEGGCRGRWFGAEMRREVDHELVGGEPHDLRNAGRQKGIRAAQQRVRVAAYDAESQRRPSGRRLISAKCRGGISSAFASATGSGPAFRMGARAAAADST